MSDTRQQPHPYLDRQPGTPDRPDKEVSQKGYARLKVAADGIAATKKVIQHQGNQVPSLQATNMNSRYRLIAMRDPRAWEYTSWESQQLAQEHQEADTAAKAELAHGGNCGEHAWVAYHYLRLHAKGQPIQYSAKDGLDHAFVIVGDTKNDKDNEMAVSDPWPNNPMACLWEDHFAFTPDRKQIVNYTSMVADGKSYKAAIMAGLKLSAYGEQLVKMADSKEETEKQTVDERESNHFWNHGDTTGYGKAFDYVEKKPAGSSASAGTSRVDQRQ